MESLRSDRLRREIRSAIDKWVDSLGNIAESKSVLMLLSKYVEDDYDWRLVAECLNVRKGQIAEAVANLSAKQMTEIKNIAITYKRLTDGGAEQAVCQLANLLSHNNYNVTLLYSTCLNQHYPLNNNVKTNLVPSLRDSDGVNWTKRIEALIEAYSTSNIELSIFESINPREYLLDLLVCISLGIPTVWANNGFYAYDLTWTNLRQYRMATSMWIAPLFNRIVVCSVDDAGYWLLFNNDVRVALPLPTSVARALRAVNSNSLSSHDLTGKRVSFIGRIDCNKRVDHVLRAFAIASKQIPDIELNVYGESRDEGLLDELKDLAESLDITDRVHWWGYLDDSSKAFLESDVTLVASRCEGFCYSLLESEAAGVPAICYDMPNIPFCNMRYGKSGITAVESGNYDAMACKLVSALGVQRKGNNAGNEALRRHCDAILNDCNSAWLESVKQVPNMPSASVSSGSRLADAAMRQFVVGLDRRFASVDARYR